MDLGGVGLNLSSVLFLVGLNFLFLRRSSTQEKQELTGHCASPDCARCNRDEKFLLRVEDLCHSLCCTYDLLGRDYPRIWGLLQSTDKREEYIRKMWHKSGYEPLEVDKLDQEICLPTIWTLPGLECRPVWTSEEHLDQLFAYVLDHIMEFVSIVSLEYDCIQNTKDLWKHNQTPSGIWKIFYLYNQGVRIDKNCSLCPCTTKIVEETPGFMGDKCIFSYAMISVLLPGSRIEPHTGPCNFRLRCHIPILSSPDYHFKVGNTLLNWNVGDIIVFDDSFVHKVWHVKRDDGELKLDGVNERVILILDIWHPQVDEDNKKYLQDLFYP